MGDKMDDNETGLRIAQVITCTLVVVVALIVSGSMIKSWHRDNMQIEYAKACFEAKYAKCPIPDGR